jgi:hypothetical protein
MSIKFTNIKFSKWYDDSNKDDIQYLDELPNKVKQNINLHNDIKIDDKPIVHKTKPIRMFSRGIPNPISKLAPKYISISLDSSQNSCCYLNRLLITADRYFCSPIVKAELFGDDANSYEYVSIVRKTDNEIRKCEPDYCNFKFIIDDGKLETVVIMDDEKLGLDNLDKVSWGTEIVYTIEFRRLWVMSRSWDSKQIYGVDVFVNEMNCKSQKKVNFINYVDFDSKSESDNED